MARLAFFSPLPPTPSGISDYSTTLLAGLTKLHDVDLYYERRSPPPRTLLPHSGRFPHDEFLWRNAQLPYDLPVYQMGNSLHHSYMHPFIFQYPGLLILHDLVIHHARGHVLLTRSRHDEYKAELEYCHPGLGRQVGDILAHIPSDFTCYQFPMNKLMVDSSLAVGTHTRFGVEQLKEASPVKPVCFLRMGIDTPAEPPAAKTDLGDAWPIIASFGFITREKRVDACLEAVKLLREKYPRLLYLLVGRRPRHYDPRPLIRKMGLVKNVRITGAVDEDEFQALLHAATVVLNLRYPSAREMSASLLRALGAGRVTLVSDLLHLTGIPHDIAPRVDLFDEAVSIVKILGGLLADTSELQRRGQRARQFIDSNHRLEHMLADYALAIDAAIAERPRFRLPESAPHHAQSLALRMRDILPEGLPPGLRL
ncbi:MAG: glycosyltransferase family 4 protein [Acidobacteria bacterium]|nr:glycosyltransferase family 4 protein [Acidobacteriota bacterium]